MVAAGGSPALRGAPHHDKIHRAAGLGVIEHAGYQPPGAPGQGVEVGAAFIQLRSVRE